MEKDSTKGLRGVGNSISKESGDLNHNGGQPLVVRDGIIIASSSVHINREYFVEVYVTEKTRRVVRLPYLFRH